METRKDRLTRRNPDGGISVDDLPAALEKLAAYEDAEAEGRLVRLPCAEAEAALKAREAAT